MTTENVSIGGSKVLFLSYFYPPSALPGAHRAAKFIRNLDEGEIYVLTVKPELYPSHVDLNFGKDVPINREQIVKTSIIDVFKILLKGRSLLTGRGGRKQSSAPSPPRPAVAFHSAAESGGRSSFTRFKDFIHAVLHFPDEASSWVFPALVAGVKLIRREKIDVIFASGMPWSGLVLGMLLQRLTGVPFIADFRDPWIGNPYHGSKGPLLDRVERRLEREVVKGATLVVANTEALRNQFLQRYPRLDPKKFVVLPNGFDAADFAAIENLQSTGKERLVLAHAGFLYLRRDPSPLIEALSLVHSRAPQLRDKISFLQMGNIHLDYDFDARYADLIEDKTVVKVAQLPHADCLQRLKSADVLVIIQPATETQIPSKLYDYLCLNRPILTITPLNGALAEMIRRHGFGDVYDPADVEGIADRLEELYAEKGGAGVLAAEYTERDCFDVVKVTAKLAGHIRELTQKAA
jgi:glycosyltransferase involved in cell wall biosynthesis